VGERLIELAHGGGGTMTGELIALIREYLGNPLLDELEDAARMDMSGRVAFTTDSFVVSPIEFPGGDIGRLAVAGTVNDLAVVGAVPKFLSLAFVIEEGLPFNVLRRLLGSIQEAVAEAGAVVACGDTKVVEHGKADGIYVTTSGLGEVPAGVGVSAHKASPGDAVIVSGALGLHGVAVMAAREGLGFASPAESDVAPLNRMLEPVVAELDVHTMRDPPRGGCAAALHEIADASGVSIVLEEDALPVPEVVEGACSLLGTDPLEMPNEGKALVILPAGEADRAVDILRSHKYGREACRIGRVVERGSFPLTLATALGERLVDAPRGELLPRIC
jgi:hydrogenase expression/formation protein HypE